MKKFNATAFQNDLLRWYRKYQRVLPWRAKNPLMANPYHVWLSEIMLQQTVVATVIPYFQKFIITWPTIRDLANAKNEDVMKAWAGLGYYARARNLISCAKQICETHGEIFPQNEGELLSLKGIGSYTSAAIRAIAFNLPSVVVDGNIERITTRIFAVKEFLPAAKPIIKKKAEYLFKDDQHPAEMAQALMDLGASICTPQNPKCDLCPVNNYCNVAFKKTASEYPRKAQKAIKKHREGDAFIFYTKTGDIWCENRADHRMLGGMKGLPSSDWDQKGDEVVFTRKSMEPIGEIRHIFSHFELRLRIWSKLVTKRDMATYKMTGSFVPQNDILTIGLPSLYLKSVKVFLNANSSS